MFWLLKLFDWCLCDSENSEKDEKLKREIEREKGFRGKIRIGILIIVVVGICLAALYGLLKPISNGCIMTYMYPTYIPISSSESISPVKYGLYLYHEGWKKIDYKEHLKKLSGVPVLFIPGNGGSFKQARSSFFLFRFSQSCFVFMVSSLVLG